MNKITHFFNTFSLKTESLESSEHASSKFRRISEYFINFSITLLDMSRYHCTYIHGHASIFEKSCHNIP